MVSSLGARHWVAEQARLESGCWITVLCAIELSVRVELKVGGHQGQGGNIV